ncbi:Hypothetical protein R9X50_00270600 [Acrodontium crateriforme]|uniref:Coupling of ubiquitin conjugation to ER degradation protein 1 n=1 Tax=Acrodontium crateriforme TaxID=150365 RepID=A0AAQ3M2M6_9PEZI|nr:Hypothetical protein R9X50_00270600 [Acrodontium crateriforme]
MAQAGNQTSINIPQLLAVALVGFFALRWYLSKPSSSSSAPGAAAPSQRRNQVDVTKIEQVASMFPQLDRRAIAWDLHRNGGNVSATTERVLSGRSLDTPPPTYQPIMPSQATNNATSTPGRNGRLKTGTGAQPDLITRYGLQSRVSGKGKEAMLSEEQMRNSWSPDKAARAEGLRKKKEEMILAARRRMEAKVTED